MHLITVGLTKCLILFVVLICNDRRERQDLLDFTYSNIQTLAQPDSENDDDFSRYFATQKKARIVDTPRRFLQKICRRKLLSSFAARCKMVYIRISEFVFKVVKSAEIPSEKYKDLHP